jgi:hypothetical protein
MNSMPIIRLEVEGMKMAILNAFHAQHVEIDTYVQKELERFCAPENLRRVVGKHVDTVVEAAIRDSLESFFRYGAGKKLITAWMLSILRNEEIDDAI